LGLVALVSNMVRKKIITGMSNDARVMTSTERALRCLNDISSFVCFEKLEGTSSHLSRVFHYVCIGTPFALISAWRPDQSAEENNENTARLLIDLHSNGLKSIQLLGHFDENEAADYQPARAFFTTYDWNDREKYKCLMLSLCQKYGQDAVAVYHDKQIRVFDGAGKVRKMFNMSTMEPTHLKKIWSAVSGPKFTGLESGYLSGNPIMFCGPQYDSVGLVSDIPIGSIGRMSQKAASLMRYRPLRNKEDAEYARLADIERTKEALAEGVLRARESATSAKADECYKQLIDFCAEHNLNADAAIHAEVQFKARILAMNLSGARKKNNPVRQQKCYESLKEYCAQHNLDPEQVIADAKHPQFPN
jgi:hypothetical protein